MPDAVQEEKDTEDEHDWSVRTATLWLVALLRFVDAFLVAVGFEGIAEFTGHLLALWLG
jgi:hypothetical protein